MTTTKLDVLLDGRLLVVAECPLPPGTATAAVDAFVTPATVARWWSAELGTTLETGGPYIAAFPALGQTMRGEILAYEPGARLEFSWSWDHEPELPVYQVTVHTTAHGESAGLRLTHGPYADDEFGRADAESHRAGWDYFLPRLLAELAGG